MAVEVTGNHPAQHLALKTPPSVTWLIEAFSSQCPVIATEGDTVTMPGSRSASRPQTADGRAAWSAPPQQPLIRGGGRAALRRVTRARGGLHLLPRSSGPSLCRTRCFPALPLSLLQVSGGRRCLRSRGNRCGCRRAWGPGSRQAPHPQPSAAQLRRPPWPSPCCCETLSAFFLVLYPQIPQSAGRGVVSRTCVCVLCPSKASHGGQPAPPRGLCRASDPSLNQRNWNTCRRLPPPRVHACTSQRKDGGGCIFPA